MIAKVKKVLTTIKTAKLYSSDDILKMGVIVDGSQKPSSFTLYRLIKNGKLPAVDMGTGKVSRHFVKGLDLKNYLKKTYQL